MWKKEKLNMVASSMDPPIEIFEEKGKIKLKQELEGRSVREGLYLFMNSGMPVLFNLSNMYSKLAWTENYAVKMLCKMSRGICLE